MIELKGIGDHGYLQGNPFCHCFFVSLDGVFAT